MRLASKSRQDAGATSVWRGCGLERNDEVIGGRFGGSGIECYGYDYSGAGISGAGVEGGVSVGEYFAGRAGGFSGGGLRAMGIANAVCG